MTIRDPKGQSRPTDLGETDVAPLKWGIAYLSHIGRDSGNTWFLGPPKIHIFFIVMDEKAQRDELIELISNRKVQDEKWARDNFLYAHVVTWIAILSSFGAAIASATDKVSPVIVAIFAAVPGTIIVIERSFAFARRASWHHLMRGNLQRLENELRYQGKPVSDVAAQYSDLFLRMEPQYPGLAGDGADFGNTASPQGR